MHKHGCGGMTVVASRAARRGFTLVELLVVIGIIAILMGLLLPVIGRVRDQAKMIKCQSNLSEIYKALVMYANDYDDRFPDSYTHGGAVLRMGLLRKSPDDPLGVPEILGLPAVLHGVQNVEYPGADPDEIVLDVEATAAGVQPRGRYLDGTSEVWICPATPEFMQAWGNSYWWSNGPHLKWKSLERLRQRSAGSGNAPQQASIGAGVVILRCNDQFKPFQASRRRGTQTQPSLGGAANNIYPHRYRVKQLQKAINRPIQGTTNQLYINGRVGVRIATVRDGATVFEYQ